MAKVEIEEGNTIPLLKFNPRLNRICFTLNNYSEFEIVQLSEFFRMRDAKYIFGFEVGESGTKHLQGYFELPKKTCFSVLKKVNSRWHLEKAKGSRESNVDYCSKDGLFESNIPVRLKLRILNSYKDVVWKDWQMDIIKIVESDPNSRLVHWFFEETGNVGKSFLAKYLVLKYDAVIASGKAADVFNQVNVWLTTHDEESPRLIIVDIPRSSMDFVSYQTLEKLKDGMLYSGKYEGGVCVFEPPHVICFANEKPDFTAMSGDRWGIRRLCR